MLETVSESKKMEGQPSIPGCRPLSKALYAIGVSFGLAAIFVIFSGNAEAAQLKAKIFLTEVSIPRGLPEKDLLSYVQKNQITKIAAANVTDVKKSYWTANLVIAFNASPGELEYQMSIYDVQGGVRVLVENRSMLLSDRIQKTYVQKIFFKAPQYQQNRNYELAVVVRGGEVGRFKFHLNEPSTAAPPASPSTPSNPKVSKETEI